jgi:UDP-glucose 4-epimerase
MILVTGGTGYIGSHTVVELMEAGYKVVVADNLSNSSIETLEGIKKIVGRKPHFEKVDLAEKKTTNKLFDKYPGIDSVIHFAALKAVGV